VSKKKIVFRGDKKYLRKEERKKSLEKYYKKNVPELLRFSKAFGVQEKSILIQKKGMITFLFSFFFPEFKKKNFLQSKRKP